MKHLMFVYGTLKRNYPLHNWMFDTYKNDFKFLEEVKTQDQFGLIDGVYPLLINSLDCPDDYLGFIKGEMFQCSTDVINKITEIETGAGYIPLVTGIIHEDKTITSCLSWLYSLFPVQGTWIKPEGEILSWTD